MRATWARQGHPQRTRTSVVRANGRDRRADSMPTVLRIGRYRFHFYSDERREPPHIHVATPDGECKFWLEPVALAGTRGMRSAELRRVEGLVREHAVFLRERYDEFHNG
jgi:hypothetical protein